ncbi:hypothetical protein [Pedobacter xixiisoli]|uniref:Uncharacterized protein n=1 Tax=Pedobacter xixiisoli TaxID=1476464 RepID=A0A286A8K4_9SPHI|nr:hypothetical protein [Pedobacter xixiisoli]SOD18250.1 hypothetical protein SAMN06297358_2904 [Pedobacter xixiisoli]
MKAMRLGVWISILGLISCGKPTEDIKIVVDTDIIKYTALIQVTDAQTGNPAPANASIAVVGENAANIYEISGKKDIKLVQGMVTIGLHPNITPTSQNPITTTVEITASGYTAQRKNITFTSAVRQQTVPIGISRVGNTAPPIVIPPPPVYQDVSLNFTGRCPNRPDVEIRPSVYVSFRKAGTNESFKYLGYMDKGNITTNLLAVGETYNFQIVYGGESYTVSQKIDQTSYNLTIDMTAACNF